jgi:hypothetical protein
MPATFSCLEFFIIAYVKEDLKTLPMADSILNFQTKLFDLVKPKIKDNQLLVEVIMEVLDCSRDAAYRRIQTKTELSFNEAVKLANHFNIALNDLQEGAKHQVSFTTAAGFIKTIDDYRFYMETSLAYLNEIGAKKDHLMYYLAKDVPVYYYFGFDKLSAFKIYVWLKSVYNIQKLNGKNYSLADIPQDLLALAQEQWKAFSKINTVEIWNDTTILSVIKQIEYFFDAGLLSNKEEALEICEELTAMLKVVYKQALSGQKVHPNNRDLESGASYQMYYHEILLMDNHIYAEINEEQKFYFIPYAGVNYINTTNANFTADIKSYVIEQTRKASLISDASEKERNKFFIRLKNRVSKLEEKIKTIDKL